MKHRLVIMMAVNPMRGCTYYDTGVFFGKYLLAVCKGNFTYF